MKKPTIYLLLLASTLAGIVGVYLLKTTKTPTQLAPEPKPEVVAQQSSAATPPTEPAIKYPIPTAAESTENAAPATAALNLQESLTQALSAEYFSKLFFSENLILRIVATVDNLPRAEAPISMFPLRAPGGRFLVSKAGDQLSIAAENSDRYTPYVELLSKLPAASAARIYISRYADFQKAYVELGYPDKYFNDRLVETLDSLLATPELNSPAQLIQPKVLYRFAEPALQTAPAGQKILLRTGQANTLAVKNWLREFRALVVHKPNN